MELGTLFSFFSNLTKPMADHKLEMDFSVDRKRGIKKSFHSIILNHMKLSFLFLKNG